jgi:hypothetical protein
VQERYDHFYFCHIAQGDQGKYIHMLLVLVITLYSANGNTAQWIIMCL